MSWPRDDRMRSEEVIDLERLCADAQSRARWSSDLARREHLSCLGPALDELVLGRAALYRSLFVRPQDDGVSVAVAARQHLEAATDALRQVGQLDHVPRALVTRAWLRCLEGDADGARADLDEAWDIAERGQMRLHMADIHLHRARLFRDTADLRNARLLIEQCGYWRRKGELDDSKAAAMDWQMPEITEKPACQNPKPRDTWH